MTLAYVYLALAVMLFVATLAAIHPPSFGRHLMPVVGLPAMVLAFFVPQIIVIGVATTVVAARYGALAHTAGQVALGVHALCWGALSVYLHRVHRSLPVLDGVPVADADHPFSDGLTADERSQLKPGQVSWRPSLTYRIPAMLDVEVTRGVVYRRIGPYVLRLDVYRPRRRSGPLPAALYIHGGGWVLGTRRQSRFMMYELASAGWAVFAISYRFAPRAPLPAALEDCKAAVAWIREHAREYDARGDRLTVIGGSAGAHLAAMVALTPNHPRFQPGFEAADTRVHGAVLFYGVFDLVAALEQRRHVALSLLLEWLVVRKRFRDDPESYRLVQPASYLSADAPPMLLVHGTEDALVPIDQSREFRRTLKAAGARTVHLLEVPLAQHAFEVFPSPLHQRVVRVIARFMATLRETGTTSTTVAAPSDADTNANAVPAADSGDGRGMS
jgi:acetyl esterase/lipase